ncbi:tRNA pseudouridine(55) synthase TruB [Puniceicoccales bacterium CK1056]|uniref:tRNA pseudouridine synthase B n=1 Tax=Oceanipulchritudo coccoides TaxID=2706888 RepID=A0A6B2LX66_9BACT|nr:tRNA pseudouridine(55) synthase TruB [Oceanipulchritudo coccoides]NDV61168.1 tRNA pseudouridine(55) synthase TruB [Oceanipulchritudo coccoides]
MSSANSYEGVLLIDKPDGMTSHDVVDKVRHKLKMKRVGHAGTLDPNATGLLIILVGKATKLSQFLMGLDKTYEGVITFGVATTTQDVEGEVVSEQPVPELSEDQLKEAMQTFVGDQYQTPPMFSAKKIDGVALYKLARKGKTVEREPRFIHISSFTLDKWETPDMEFTLSCSKGTYVRTVANDLGEKLGCGGYLKELRRTDIERFHIEDSIELETFQDLPVEEIKGWLIPSYQAVPSNAI